MPLVFLIFLILIPVLLFFLFYGLISISFVRLGIPRSLVAVLFISILVGSLINIPVWSVSSMDAGEMFRSGNLIFTQPPRVSTTIVAVNVGGAIIPVLLTLFMLPKAPLFRTAIAVLIVTLVAYGLSEVVPGQGIKINALVPPAVSALTAMILAWRSAAPVAYISGVLGTLIGGDLLHLNEVLETGGTFLSIGGAGIFDGIFLIGIFAAFLSPGERKPAPEVSYEAAA